MPMTFAAAMAAERELAAGKSTTSPALFSTPDFPAAGAGRLLEAAVTGSLRKTEEALAAGVPAACADANGGRGDGGAGTGGSNGSGAR